MYERLVKRVQESGSSGLRELLAMAIATSCINLGPGVCDVQPHPRIIEAGRKALSSRRHSYAPCDGVPELRQAIADRYRNYNKWNVQPEQVLVTCGAAGAMDSVCRCFLAPGDEVVLFEPFYQYHVRQILQQDGVPRYVRLSPGSSFSVQELKNAITSRTKMLVLSNPSNPTGKVFSRWELEEIGRLCKAANVMVVCDEVYEYFLSPGHRHTSMGAIPDMFDHTLTLSSASKTFLATGWRVGWLVGPRNVVRALAMKCDETYLCAPTPLQYAVAECLQFEEEFFEQVRDQFERKRMQLCSALQHAGFDVHFPQGAFYILAGYDPRQYSSDVDALKRLMDEFGIAAVPGSEFFARPTKSGLLRFCFAVEQDLLDAACERLTTRKIARSDRASPSPRVVSHA